MNKTVSNILRYALMTIGTLLVILLVLPALLYVPVVQDAAKDVACNYARTHLDIDITVGQVRLKFPLDLNLDSVTVVDTSAGSRDTMAVVNGFSGGIEVLPLLRGEFSLGTVKLLGGYYHMTSADSSMLLKAWVDRAVLKGTDLTMKTHVLNLVDGDLNGGRISLTQYPWKKKIEPDTAAADTASTPWRVNVLRVTLRNISYTMRMLPTVDKLSAHVALAQLNGGKIDLGEGTVVADDFRADSVQCQLAMLSERDTWRYDKLHPVPEDTSASSPWRVTLGHVGMTHVDYGMRMLPTIDRLTAQVSAMALDSAIIDTGRLTVTAQSLRADSARCRYLLPRIATQGALPRGVTVATNASSDSQPWTVVADTVLLTHSRVTYAKSGAKPKHGLDPDYIALSDAGFKVTGLYNRGTTVRLNLDSLRLAERCGLRVLSGRCHFAMQGGHLDVTGARLRTRQSSINLDAHAPMSLFDTKPWGRFSMNARSQISLPEVTMIMPELRTMLKPVPQSRPVTLNAKLSGTPSALLINSLNAALPGYAHASAKGTVLNPLNVKRLRGNVDFNIAYTNINFVKPMVLDKATAKQINLPPLSAKGHVNFTTTDYAGNVAMRVRNGSLVGRGTFKGNSQAYSLNAQLAHFPVRAFMPSAPVDDITGHVTATGHGFDFLNANTATNANINLASILYDGQRYSNITAQVKMLGGKIAAAINSKNKNADFSLNADGKIVGQRYIFSLNGIINDLDAKALGLMDVECRGKGQISGFFDYDARTQNCNLNADLSQLKWAYDGSDINSDATEIKFVSNDHQVQAYIDNEDTHLDFTSQCSLKDFTATLQRVAKIAQEQISKRDLNINALQDALPVFTLELKSGPNGIVPRYLEKYDIDFREINAQIKNDSTLTMNGYVHSLAYGSTAIDTITFQASEVNRYLGFKAHMGNRPGTWDDFAQVDVVGGAVGSTVDFLVNQHNIEGKQGYRLGANATLAGNVVKVKFFPSQPVIAYRNWEINDSNYINFNYNTRMLDADFVLKSDSSSLALRTEPTADPGVNNVLLNIKRFNLEQWLGSNIMTTPIGGTLDADMKLAYDGKSLAGNGNVSISGFSYDHVDEGDVALNTDLSVDPTTKATKLNGTIDLDGQKVALAYGTISADTASASPLDVNVQFMRFPLAKASPFIPGYMIQLRGYMEGGMTVTGKLDNPIINGYVQGDSAIVALPAYGSSLRLCDDRIAVTNGKVTLDNYKILGLNDEAINVNGYYDIGTSLMDIKAQGHNVQFVGSEQERFSELFGKGFADVMATVQGNAETTNVRASVNLLAGSNLTYVMQDEVTTIGTSTVDENMVTFINPNDTLSQFSMLKTLAATPSSSSIVVDIGIEDGAKLGAYLSVDGKDRVTVEGNGRLRYSLDFAGKDNMVGTYTVTSGNVRYSPPIISQKVFDITGGSYIKWTGEMLNPELNVTGTENVKASVTGTDGNSRLVDFLVTAMVGNTLNNIDLQFDMSSDNDMTVQNELQSMTDTQRSNAAINLLLYGTYSGMSSSNMNLSSTGALYSFLQSQLNGWAAKTLKGVDLTFGINQYDNSKNGKSSTETSYSYRLSKSLFNDRFKVVVGGEYSTEASSEENFSNNLVSDISFEYDLNAAGTRYFRLFRHTGFESVLEGEVTETGVGYVLKRKLNSLRDIFKFNWFGSDKKKKPMVAQPTPSESATEPTTKQATDEPTTHNK